MKYFKKMVGERIFLSPINLDDAELYTKWLNDSSVSNNLGNYRNLISFYSEQKILETMTTDGHNYAIVSVEKEELLGNISFLDIDHLSRRATLGLFIGEAEHRGKGYGAEAIRILLEYGFRGLNFHNVMLQVHSDNEMAMACYKKVGFREFGRRHEAQYKNGNYVDIVHMEILESDFYGTK